MDLFDLTGKTAIVTGAAGGLGKGYAEALADAGAVVAIIDIVADTPAIAEEMSKNGRKIVGVQGDLTNREDLRRVFDACVEKLGGHLDIMVNNAGIQVRGPAEEIPLEGWDRAIELNLTATFELCQLAGRKFFEQGGGGKIVNVASMLSFFGGLNCCPYTATKGAIAQLTKALSNEWAGRGVNVNAIAPGYLDTPLNTKLRAIPERDREITARIPAHRWGVAEDLMGTMIYLCSRASDYVSGAIIPVDGGYLGR